MRTFPEHRSNSPGSCAFSGPSTARQPTDWFGSNRAGQLRGRCMFLMLSLNMHASRTLACVVVLVVVLSVVSPRLLAPVKQVPRQVRDAPSAPSSHPASSRTDEIGRDRFSEFLLRYPLSLCSLRPTL